MTASGPDRPDAEASGAPVVVSRRSWISATRQRHPILGFLVVRIAVGLATLFAASVLIFGATQLLPGDTASVVLGKNANPTALHELRERLGTEGSVVSQYFSWLGGILRGDFGDSATRIAQGAPDAPISGLLSDPLLNTAILSFGTFLVMFPIALLLGMWAGLRPGRPSDHALAASSLGLAALPEFVIGSVLLLLLFTATGLLPPVSIVAPGASPLDNPEVLVLPILTLVLYTVGWGIRQIRTGVIEVSGKGYVVMARLNGIEKRRVVRRYIVRNSLATSVQILAQLLQYLVGGVIVVEVLFAYSGLGQLLVESVGARDFRQVQAVAMILAAFYIAVNIVADLLVVMLVPRLRGGGR